VKKNQARTQNSSLSHFVKNMVSRIKNFKVSISQIVYFIFFLSCGPQRDPSSNFGVITQRKEKTSLKYMIINFLPMIKNVYEVLTRRGHAYITVS
jgi:hypothetical protein